MGSEEKTRVMVRVPDNVCRVMDTLAGHTHVSRPDVVIDACRRFYAALCQREADILDLLDERHVAKDVALAFYREEIAGFVAPFRSDYDASLGKTKDQVSILVVFPNVLLSKMNAAIGRIGTVKNHQEFIKIALMYMFSWERESMRHEQRMAEFVSSADIRKEVEKLRDLLNDGQNRADKKTR